MVGHRPLVRKQPHRNKSSCSVTSETCANGGSQQGISFVPGGHEVQLVGRFTVTELAARARFYGTPEGLSLARKGLAFTAAIHPMLEAEIAAWVRSLQQSPTAAQAGGGPIQPHN